MRLSAAAFLVFSLPAAALAQTEPEIVITARRPTAAANTIGDAAALSAQQIQRIAPQHPAEALNRLPSVNIHRNNGVESLPAIRSPVLTGGQGAGSFLVLQDGAPIRSPAFGNVNSLFETDLGFAAAVEVSRGPGAAVYGSNAVNGLVDVRTPAPAAAEPFFTLRAGAFGRLSTAALAPIGENAYAALSLIHEGGWRDQAGFDQQSLLLVYGGALGGWESVLRISAQNLNQETASFIQGADAYRCSACVRANPTPNAYRDQKLLRAQSALVRRLNPNLELRLTPYGRFIETDLALSFLPSQAQEVSRQAGGGVQSGLYLDRGDWSFVFGLDADWTRGALSWTQTLPTIAFNPATTADDYPQGVQYDYQVDALFTAAFGQFEARLSPRLRASGGLRLEHARLAYDNRLEPGDFGRFRRPADRTDAFLYATPKLGLALEVSGGLVFLNAARGARAPQATDLYSLQVRQNAGEQRAERINSLEAGWRQRFGPLKLELIGYAQEKRNSAFRNAAGFTVIDARTASLGLEAQADWRLGRHWRLSGWATYARHTYQFNSAVDSIKSGADIDTAPRWLSNVQALYTPTDNWEFELEWVRTGQYFTDEAGLRLYPGHSLFNLRARYQFSPRWAAHLALRNLENRDYAERADFAFGNDRYFPGERRALTLGLIWRP